MLTSKNVSTLGGKSTPSVQPPTLQPGTFSIFGWSPTVKSPRSLQPETEGPPESLTVPHCSFRGLYITYGRQSSARVDLRYPSLDSRLCSRLCHLLASAVEAIVASCSTRGSAEAWSGPDPGRRGSAKFPSLAIMTLSMDGMIPVPQWRESCRSLKSAWRRLINSLRQVHRTR